MDKNKLKSKMALYGDTGTTLAQYLGISHTTFSAKLNNKNAEFTKEEMGKMRKRYELSDEEFMEIFYPS